MSTEKKDINNEIKHLPINNDKWVVYVNTENKKLKEQVPSYNSFSIQGRIQDFFRGGAKILKFVWSMVGLLMPPAKPAGGRVWEG